MAAEEKQDANAKPWESYDESEDKKEEAEVKAALESFSEYLADDAPEQWEVKVEKEKEEEEQMKQTVLEALGLTSDDVNGDEADCTAAKEGWELKIEKEAKQEEEQHKAALEALGISETDLDESATDGYKEAWEMKKDKEDAQEGEAMQQVLESLGLQVDGGDDGIGEEVWEKKAKDEEEELEAAGMTKEDAAALRKSNRNSQEGGIFSRMIKRMSQRKSNEPASK